MVIKNSNYSFNIVIVFGIYVITKDAEIFEGIVFIFLAFIISIDHWIKLFKNKK